MNKNLLEPKQKAYNIISMFNKEIIYRYRKIPLTNYDWYEIDPDCKFVPINFIEKILNEQKTFDDIKYWQEVLEEIYML